MQRFFEFIPSFVSQRSRLGKEKLEFIKHEVLPRYEISSFKSIKAQNVSIEIGSGYGDTITHLAKNIPQITFIACEVYIDALSSMCKKIEEENIENIKLYTDDARVLLSHCSNEFLENIYLFFPDPWPKKRHHKRRIIKVKFLKEIARCLKAGGKLFIATDDNSYKEWILEVIASQTFMILESREQPKWWIETKFQKKATIAGRISEFFTLKKA